ncbi:hypothetical protein Q5H92_08940 [Hymenobacter sp. M29]|uniref:DUF4468 domain-containing protein n=1 Tax=Hymenobacter mellowenesis TaxID=3063995 RepID=A0ABT9A9G6_9BACT|nr:hypothetical protein [Hymenobacter sp. M29]MDO7846481.1 hypothetical protein [Hymenobacter sp. M29]
MKNALYAVALGLLISATSYAQAVKGYASLPKDSLTQKVSYSGVVSVPGATQTALFGRASEWIARQTDRAPGEPTADAGSGMQLVRLRYKQAPQGFTDTHANLYYFAVAIYTKEGRFRYQVDDVTYQNENPALTSEDVKNRVPLEKYATAKPSKNTVAAMADLDKHLREVVASLTQSMGGAKAW